MISIEEGLQIVLDRADAAVGADYMPADRVDLSDCLERLLREEVRADDDSPPFDRSIRDGFALTAADVAQVPVDLVVVGESRAGKSFEGRIETGRCAEIMTGSEVPEGTDSVVMVEHTERVSEDRVRILRTAKPGQNIQVAGSECREGDLILEPGRRIHVTEVGILASTGHSTVAVSRKPRVAILSTGDELVGVNEVPGPARIRNSNSFALGVQVQEAGGEPKILGIARDDPQDLSDKIGQGLRHDVLVTSGGVSMGKYDLVTRVLKDHGVEIGFDRVAMKPGKPTVFGWRGRAFVFGLPGNPVSTIVSFQLFVRPLLRRLLHAVEPGSGTLEATLEKEMGCDPVRAGCLPARVHFESGTFRLSPVEWKGSSDLVGLSRANAYVLVPMQEGSLTTGTVVQFFKI